MGVGDTIREIILEIMWFALHLLCLPVSPFACIFVLVFVLVLVGPIKKVDIPPSFCAVTSVSHPNTIQTQSKHNRIMTNTTYIDWLPTKDIIHECIMPMLDYESRIQFNQSLKPIERMSWRFPAKNILSHELTVAAKSLHYSLDKVRYIDQTYYGGRKKRLQKKAQTFVSLLEKFREGRRERAFLHHDRKLYDVTIQKLYSILDMESDVIQMSTPYFKKKIRRIASELLPGLLKIQPRNFEGRFAVLPMECAVAVF